MSKKNLKKISGKAYYGIITAIALVAVILINIIFSFVNFRIDFTKDQRYSLTSTTIDYLKSDTTIQDKILFKIYLDGDLPGELKRMENAIRSKLDEFRYYAGDNIQYKFINPYNGSKESRDALREQLFDKGRGIRPLEITYRKNGSTSSITVFPGAEVEYQGNKVGYVRFLKGGQYQLDDQLNALVQKGINNIEYNLMQIIAKATRKHKKTIAFIHGQGELKIANTVGARKNIEDGYVIKDVVINGALHSLDKFDGIIIADPQTQFSDKDKFIIDQYLMQGGNIMVFNCPLRVNNDTIRWKGETHSERKLTGLSKLLFEYGIKVNKDLVVDANYTPMAFPGIPKGYINWYFYVLAQGTNSPISSMVNPVKLPYASSLEFVRTANAKHTSPTVILTSSSNSKSYGMAPLVSIGVDRVFGENPQFQENPDDKNNRLMLGGIVQGNFQSAFKNRIVSTYLENKNASFIPKSTQPGKVMVIGNGTFFQNQYYDSTYVPEENRWRYIPRLPRRGEIDELLLYNPIPIGNFQFFENCVDYMCGESTLLAIRSRTIDLRPIDKLKVEKEGTFYKIINIVIPVGIVLLMAFIILFLRKYKYVKK